MAGHGALGYPGNRHQVLRLGFKVRVAGFRVVGFRVVAAINYSEILV